jgi:hypothetical protein
MECDICLVEWDSVIHIPRILSCGHTICEVCLLGMLKKAKPLPIILERNNNANKSEMFCPSCMKKQPEISNEEDIKKLIKNINLLRITEKIESKKNFLLQSHRSMLTSRDNFNFNTTSIDYMSNNYNEKFETLSSKIENTNCQLKNTQPSQNNFEENLFKIDSTEIKLTLIKQELERLQEFFDSYLSEFEKTSMFKLEDLFDYLQKLITYNYNTAKTVIQQCKKEQSLHIESKVNEIKFLFDEVSQIENKLNKISIDQNDENFVSKCTNEIDEIFNRVNNFMNYDSELALYDMKINFKENIKESLFDFIQNSYNVDVDFLQIRGETPTINHALQKETLWSCVCGEMENPHSEVRCHNCGIFRKLETFENIISNPNQISKDELLILKSRRKQEIKIFQEILNSNNTHDENSRNLNKNKNSCSEKFYAINMEWFLLWKCFVTNDLSEKILSNSKKRISLNKGIGVLPPGCISNFNLFNLWEKNLSFSELTVSKLRPKMRKNEHYIIIKEAMWKFFYSNYNAHIKIELRNNKDIYSGFSSASEVKFYYENTNKKIEKFPVITPRTERFFFNKNNFYLLDNIKTEKNEEEKLNVSKASIFSKKANKKFNGDEIFISIDNNFRVLPTEQDRPNLDSPKCLVTDNDEGCILMSSAGGENIKELESAIKSHSLNYKNIMVKFNTDKKFVKNKPLFLYEEEGWEGFQDLNNTSKY